MGRGKFKKQGRDQGRRGPRPPQRYKSYQEIEKANELLEKYYNSLLQLPEEEKSDFWAALRRELPNSFRFCGSKGHALQVKRLLESRYIPDITKIKNDDGEPVDPPNPLPWYPDELAWWMTTPKNIIRKFPPFAHFQRFLVSETTVGNISRQEAVSMIPPLLMDLHPDMTVLDLCAAPGSKSAQLLEMLHAGEEARLRSVQHGTGDSTADTQAGDDGRATGLLVANDSDYKRCHLLIHQLKRLSSPNVIVTNCDATAYPQLKTTNPEDPSQLKALRFDRVLADVPCSGDGTLRKNINLWRDWKPAGALGLHLVQVRILVRALQLLKPGGRTVYSTCSMNPVENEAVIAAAIGRCGGPDTIEIVDCSDRLPLLKRKPGLQDWKIMDKSGRIWESWREVQETTAAELDGVTPARLVETMFPPSQSSDGVEMPLERCMRIYAHHQDTGCFFIAVLHKKADFKAKYEEKRTQVANRTDANGGKRPRDDLLDDLSDEAVPLKRQRTESDETSEPEIKTDLSDRPAANESAESLTRTEVPAAGEDEDVKQATDVVVEIDAMAGMVKEEDVAVKGKGVDAPLALATNQTAQQPTVARRADGGYEEPFKYLDPTHDVIKSIVDFYKISPRFPSDRFLVRNALGEPAKAIYYTSALARDVLVTNEGRAVRFVHGGVRMFVKQDSPSPDVCRWRVQYEGMRIIHGYIGHERVVVLRDKSTLRTLLIEMFPKISDGGWENLGKIGERCRDLKMGCCVLRVEPDGTDPDFTEHMAIPLWRSIHSLNLMLPKDDRNAMLLRIYNETTTLVNIGDKKQNGSKGDEVIDCVKPEVAEEDGGEKTEEAVEAAEADGVAVAEEGGLAAAAAAHAHDGAAKAAKADVSTDL